MKNDNSALAHLVKIESPRLIMRPVQLGDETPLNKAINNSAVILQKWQSWANDLSIEATKAFVQRAVFAWESGIINDFPMAIILKANNKLIGVSGYNHRSDINSGHYEIGYWCDITYQGQGYITECVNALCRHAFEVLLATQVDIITHIDNQKSIHVAQRLQFKKTQVINDGLSLTGNPGVHVKFSITDLQLLPSLAVKYAHQESERPITQIIKWAIDIINIKDTQSLMNSKAIVKTPWSDVIELNLGGQLFYLKRMPRLISQEPVITQILSEKYKAPVPMIVAHNPNLKCFLMKNAGDSLRTRLKVCFDVKLICEAILQFSKMQKAVQDGLDEFINIGVPLWETIHLPVLFEQALLEKDILLRDGLDDVQISLLRNLVPKIEQLSKKMSQYAIKDTLVQSDFHDNNILIDLQTQKITFIDLGEVVITHPFFSLVGLLRQMIKHHGLTPVDSEYQKIQKACWETYSEQLSQEQFKEAFEIAKKLWYVYEILAQIRLMKACGIENLMDVLLGKLTYTSLEFLKAMKSITL